MRASSSTRSSRPRSTSTAFEPMVLAAKKAGVQRFIYCSSSSVYGVSDQPNVTEDHPLVPLTLYNKYKGMCEPLLFKHTDRRLHLRGHPPGDGLRLRPAHAARSVASTSSPTTPSTTARSRCSAATRCGRTCTSQDMVDAVRAAARRAGREDRTARSSTSAIQNHVDHGHRACWSSAWSRRRFPEKGEIEIVTTPTDDNRSYHINSDKIHRVLGFAPKRTIEDAVRDLCRAFTRRQAAEQLWTTTATTTSARMKKLQAA